MAVNWIYLLTAVLLLCYRVRGIQTIQIKGNIFFNGDGNQFFIKGITYYNFDRYLVQPDLDPTAVNDDDFYLINADQCKIDAKLIAATGANTIRVGSVNPTLNHDECMQAFADYNIYVLCDLSSPTMKINDTRPQWTMEICNEFAKIMDVFNKYDNLLAFLVGNQALSGDLNSYAPVVKAVIADMKNYRDLQHYRKIPIGYYAENYTPTLTLQQIYFDCGNDSIASDFFAFDYNAWCPGQNPPVNRLLLAQSQLMNYDIPLVFLTDASCDFETLNSTALSYILGVLMAEPFSGGFNFHWHPFHADGLASYANYAITGTPALLPQYIMYKSVLATWTPTTASSLPASSNTFVLVKNRTCSDYTEPFPVYTREGTSLPTLGMSGLINDTASATATGKVPVTSDSAADDSSGLSGGAIAGIVVGGDEFCFFHGRSSILIVATQEEEGQE